MTAIDRLGFHVRFKTSDGVHGLRIAFPREVKDSNEVRSVFIEMIRACG
jgi:heme iron utilization protein